MRIRDILHQKGERVITIAPAHTIHQAMRKLVQHQIGALVVRNDGIEGIITERDILQFATRQPADLDRVTVAEIMTRDVVVAIPNDPLDYAMDILTNNRIRHLPIAEDGRLVGLVSIGDVVNALRSNAEAENRYLHDYIAGVIA